jgi:hypothetical protein
VEMWGDLRGDGDGSDAVWALYVCIWSIEFRTIRERFMDMQNTRGFMLSMLLTIGDYAYSIIAA